LSENRRLYTAEHIAFTGTGTAFDPDTGEALIYAPAATHRVVNLAQSEAFKERQQAIKSGRGVEFTITNMNNIDEVIERVSDKHCGYLLYLQCFVNYDTTLANPNRTAMSKEDVRRTLGVSKPTVNAFLAEMIDNAIIFEDSGNYRLNPRYHFQGKTSNTAIVRTFVAKVKELYSEVSAKDLGFVYKLLQHIHLETNTICANPYERDVENTVPLTKEDIARITGVDEKTVYRKLRKLKFGDQYVFAEVMYGRARYYKINPFVFYRKPGVPDATLREMFSIRNNYRG
jgi:predicted transcriptional regulator